MSPPWKKRWLIFALLMTTCPVNAEPPGAHPRSADSKPVNQRDIERLIWRLGSDSFADREEAMKELRRLGKPALEALRTAAANSSDKEVRRRAAELVTRLLEPPYEKRFKEGVRLLDKKDYRKAAEVLHQAAELYGKDPTIPRVAQGHGDQPLLAQIYLHLARAYRGLEDCKAAGGCYDRAVYYYDSNQQKRPEIEHEWRAMVDALLERWEKDAKAKIGKHADLKALVAKYPLVILHSRGYAGRFRFKSAYSFIDETADEKKIIMACISCSTTAARRTILLTSTRLSASAIWLLI